MNATNLSAGCTSADTERGGFGLYEGPDIAEQIAAIQEECASAFTRYFNALAFLSRTRAAVHLRRARRLGWKIKRLQEEGESI